MAITNYETSWEGMTGLDVETFIKDKLKTNETAANTFAQKGVVRIVAAYKNAGTAEEDPTTIVIQGFNASGAVVTTSEFSTITKASYTQHFNDNSERDYSVSSIIEKGQNLAIPYDYYVLDENSNKVAGYTAKVNFVITCGGNKKTHETVTYKSTKSSVVPLGSFTIPADKLMIGYNHIELAAVTTVGTTQTSVYTQAYDVYVSDLKLSVTVTNGYYNPRNGSDLVTFNFTVNDTNGNGIPSNFIVKKRIYISRISPSNLSGYANDIKGDSISGTYTNFLKKTTSYANAELSGLPTITFLAQAYITDGSSEFVSNTVLIQMLCTEGMQQTPNTAYVAAMFNDVTLDKSTIITTSKQYAKVDYSLYMYSVNGSNYTISTQVSGSNPVIRASGSVPASELTPVTYSLVYRESGNINVSIGTFSFLNKVTALATGMAEPTGASLSLIATEKAVGSKDETWTDGTTTCNFNGFDWVSNGWMTTPEGTALAVTGGATLTINYAPFDKTKYSFNDYPYTISFRYKIANGADESETLISCMANDTGFVIKPQYVELKTSALVSQNISNDDVHEVTFVYYGNSEGSGIYRGLQAIYIDGTIQTIAAAGAFVPHTTSIAVTATTASVYLYSVKAFRRALSFTEIQSLYCFNQSDTEAISSYVLENDIFKTNTTAIGDYGQNIDRTKLPKDSVVLILYGREDNPTPWATINSYAMSEENKKAKHALAGAHLYTVGYTAHPMNFYMVGGCLGAQGTSSMAYPVKNFRLYLNKKASGSGIADHDSSDSLIGYIEHFYQGNAENPLPANFNPSAADSASLETWEKRKPKKNYYTAEYSIFSKDYINPETGIGDSVTSAPANRFCLKADYAESSGVHNTGFARFSNELFKDSEALAATDITSSKESSLTPPQQAVKEAGSAAKYKYDVRMNIDGRPIYLFGVAPAHQENGISIPETEYYLGRYNFNNDKSNVKVFGFEGVKDYEENPIVKAEGKALQMLALQSGIDPFYAETHLASAEDEYINPTECWEFSSNDGISREMGSFHYDKNTAFTTTLDSSDPMDSSVQALAWLNATWEYRYPDLEDESGDLRYRRGESKPYLLNTLYNFLYDNNYDLNPSQTTLNRFADNLHYYFNVNSAIKYFILTHWFLCMDQRIKNSMLAFWCDPYGVSSEEAAASPMHYMRAYYIFYDNDTILGLDNTGAIINPWDLYETDTGSESLHAKNYNQFPGNGIHGLWTNLQKCYELYRDGKEQLSSAYKLGSLVAIAYRNMREKATDEIIHSYFDNKFPDAVPNVDLEVKYLNPNNIRTATGQVELPQHLEMAQGTREFHRNNLITKRTLWFDDIYGAAAYKNYSLKYKTPGQPCEDKGTVALTINPNFRFWNFFLDWDKIHRESGFVTPAQVATLTAYSTDHFSISDFVGFSDLYACKSIDFTNYTWDPNYGIGQIQVNGVFPFLEDFKLHPVDGVPTRSQEIPWITPQVMPNLVSLVCCNLIPREGSTYGTFKLRDGNVEFSKLETLDLRGTPVSEVVFPSSAALKTINLDNPVTVNLANKSNVTSINIGTANLNSLTVRTSSSAVYGWALAAANEIFGENQKDITIIFGEDAEHPYIINSDNANQLTLLDQLATKVKNGGLGHSNVTISGNIFTTESFDSESIEEVFQNLNISDQLSGDGFALTWQTDLYEDSIVATTDNVDSLNCLVVRANMDVARWSIKIDDQDGYTLNNRVKIVKTTKQRCYIHADPYVVNSQYDNKDHKLVVYAELANGDVHDSYTLSGREIVIYYQPITYLSASTETPYVTGVASPIDFTFNSNTKAHMLTQAYVEANSSSFTATSTNNASVSWRYNPDGVLVGANVTLSNQQDSTISFNILGVKASITIFYDSEIVSSFAEVINTSDLYWIKLLRTALGQSYNIGNSLTKSQASKISLIDTTNYLSIVYNQLTEQQISTPQNFASLQYFKLGSGTNGVFEIPAVAFTNMSFPIGTTAVQWNSLPNDVGSIGTITVRDTVKKMLVNLNTDSFLSNVVIDLSATSITKIGNYGTQLSALDNYVCSFSLTYVVNAYGGIREKALFIYPPTLVEIGNTDKTIATIVNQNVTAPLMFNLRPSGGDKQVTLGSSTAYYAPYPISGFVNPVKIGAVCSFRSIGSTFGTDWSKITETFQSNVYDNDANILNGVFTLPSVVKIGDYTLYHDAQYTVNTDQIINEVRLNANITEIGENAFGRGNYVIKNNSAQADDIATFNNVTSIGNAAFYLMTKPQKLRFSANLKSIGGNAFTCLDTTFDVYIDKTDALQDVQANSFGDASSTTIIHVPAGSALYTQLTAQGMDCRNRVQTI